jgi:hypothetical protein
MTSWVTNFLLVWITGLLMAGLAMGAHFINSKRDKLESPSSEEVRISPTKTVTLDHEDSLYVTKIEVNQNAIGHFKVYSMGTECVEYNFGESYYYTTPLGIKLSITKDEADRISKSFSNLKILIDK